MILKMTREKSNVFENVFEKLNSFLDDVENAKMTRICKKTYFFGFSLFFSIFGFFENISKHGSKIG